MRTIVITPPAPIVTWEEADQHLELDGDESRRAQVEAMISAATGNIDGPDGWLGRCLGEQVLELRLNGFTCIEIELPCPEIISVESVIYIDSAGATQSLDPEVYEVSDRIIAPVWGASWPATARARDCVRIRYRAGYAAGAPALAVARAAVLLMVGDLFRFRETAEVGSSAASAIPMSTTVQMLLGPLRVFR